MGDVFRWGAARLWLDGSRRRPAVEGHPYSRRSSRWEREVEDDRVCLLFFREFGIIFIASILGAVIQITIPIPGLK